LKLQNNVIKISKISSNKQINPVLNSFEIDIRRVYDHVIEKLSDFLFLKLSELDQKSKSERFGIEPSIG